MTDATLAQLWAFVSEGVHVADTAFQDFNRMVQDFRLEQEEQQEDLRNLHANRVDPRSIKGIVEDSMTSRLRLGWMQCCLQLQLRLRRQTKHSP